jgi:hypothetical protein
MGTAEDLPMFALRWLLPFLGGALFSVALPPDLGPLYENKTVGFAIKPFKDWNAVPPQPREKYQIVGWVSKHEQLARKQHVKYNPEMNILVFRTAEPPDPNEDPKKAAEEQRMRDEYGPWSTFSAYADRYLKGRGVSKEGEPTKKEINGVAAQVWTLMFNDGHEPPVRRVVYVFPGDGCEVAVEYTSMDEWFSNLSGDIEASAKTFKFTGSGAKPTAASAGKSSDGSSAPGTTTDQDSPAVAQKKLLDEQIAKLPPGWKHFVSKKGRYLILYDAEDGFVKQLAVHLEAMRDYYETVFVPDQKITAISIVRVCKDETMYHGYGGPPSTGGYWSSRQHELVVFQNKNVDQLGTFGVISHEAFHQYIYYFYGEISPHSWYNEGHGDYFSGAVLGGDKVVDIKPYRRAGYDRESTIKEAVRAGTYTPLKKFVKFSQEEYYSGNVDLNYSEGWSIIYFLRAGKKEGVKFDGKWSKVLDDYLRNLVAARDKARADSKESFHESEHDGSIQSNALAATFSSWSDEDWVAFEAAWKKFYS